MSKIVYCNKEITDIRYSGYTITKAYACGGAVVYEKEVVDPCLSVTPPDCVLNYNAKNYNASAYIIPKLSGQTNDVDCTISFGDTENIVVYPDHLDLTKTSGIRGNITSSKVNYYNHCCMTIVAKAYNPTTPTVASSKEELLGNHSNWGFQWKKDKVIYYSSSSAELPVSSSEPNIVSVKVYGDDAFGGGGGVDMKNHTTGKFVSTTSFVYNKNNVNNGAMFNSAYPIQTYWKGNFYWICMVDGIISDEKIQNIIDYNESCFV